MLPFQREFIKFILAEDVLQFGNFTLKSGRQSPYFFNLGLIYQGQSLRKLGIFYAQALAHAIQEQQINFDILFGPAYKGITIATITAMALAEEFNMNKAISFNRKEIKHHGEGGDIVGSPLNGRILILDDVITAGTAINQVLQIINRHEKAQVTGIMIALDRQEPRYSKQEEIMHEHGQKSSQSVTALKALEKELQIPILSIIQLQHIVEYLKEKQPSSPTTAKIENFWHNLG